MFQRKTNHCSRIHNVEREGKICFKKQHNREETQYKKLPRQHSFIMTRHNRLDITVIYFKRYITGNISFKIRVILLICDNKFSFD